MFTSIGKAGSQLFRKRLILFATLLALLLATVVPLTAAAAPLEPLAASCDSWYWTGECCPGFPTDKKLRARECVASNGTSYTEFQCSFWSTCG